MVRKRGCARAFATTSSIARSVLVEELEIERVGGPQQTPILLGHPYFGQEQR